MDIKVDKDLEPFMPELLELYSLYCNSKHEDADCYLSALVRRIADIKGVGYERFI